jgi:hypothetical protein
MMEIEIWPSAVFGAVLAFLVLVIPLGLTIERNTRLTIMKEAFERGHAVQCLGKEGYFWECEE